MYKINIRAFIYFVTQKIFGTKIKIFICRMYGIYVTVLKFNKWSKLSTSIFYSSALCSTDYEINNNLFLKIIFCNRYN